MLFIVYFDCGVLCSCCFFGLLVSNCWCVICGFAELFGVVVCLICVIICAVGCLCVLGRLVLVFVVFLIWG